MKEERRPEEQKNYQSEYHPKAFGNSHGYDKLIQEQKRRTKAQKMLFNMF